MISSDSLDEMGFVLDFTELKASMERDITPLVPFAGESAIIYLIERIIGFSAVTCRVYHWASSGHSHGVNAKERGWWGIVIFSRELLTTIPAGSSLNTLLGAIGHPITVSVHTDFAHY